MNRQAFLTDITRHGMNKIQQHGSVWDILQSDPDGTILIKSLAMTFKCGDVWSHDMRWVKLKNDKNFIVEII
jgi:hypothetical protein